MTLRLLPVQEPWLPPVQKFTEKLHRLIWLSEAVMINLIREKIDEEAFLLMKKSDLAVVGLSDRYIELCCHFPEATIVDAYLD